MENIPKHLQLIDEAHGRIGKLFRLRLPWLIVGLLGGTAASFLVSRFEQVLAENIGVAFFLPMIVYMSDAVGTQTETIFVRTLAREKFNFYKYILKEALIGALIGVTLGLLIGMIASIWLGIGIGFTVGLAMFINITIAPIVAIIIPEILFKERNDPALGAGPITTVIQDFISLLIYFSVATVIIWHKFIL